MLVLFCPKSPLFLCGVMLTESILLLALGQVRLGRVVIFGAADEVGCEQPDCPLHLHRPLEEQTVADHAREGVDDPKDPEDRKVPEDHPQEERPHLAVEVDAAVV